MMRKYVQLGMLAAGAMLVVGSMTACSGDSTATAPIDTDPLTTSSQTSSSSPSPVDESTADSEATTPVEETQHPDGRPNEGGDTPAPEPDAEPDPGNGGGGGQAPDTAPDGQPLSDKQRAYLDALNEQDIRFDGDADNNVALTMAEYICHAQSQNADPAMIRTVVTATGVGGSDPVQADATADKVIRAANDHYC